MREIIFRAKAIEGGDWVYGDYEYNPAREIARIHSYNEDGTYKGQIVVDKDTIGQFTEMCDKNGNRIFEGDIVRFTNGQKRDSEGNWIDNTQDYEVSFQFGCHNIISFCSCQDAIELIGNIYDKKEGE